jgi:phosphatidylserine synthase
MNFKLKPFNSLYIFGGVLLLAGALLYPTKNQYFAPYIFAVGAGAVILYHFLDSMKFRKTGNYQQRRFYALCFLVSVSLIPAVYLMFKNQRYWLAMLLVYCVAIFFLTFRAGKIKDK